MVWVHPIVVPAKDIFKPLALEWRRRATIKSGPIHASWLDGRAVATGHGPVHRNDLSIKEATNHPPPSIENMAKSPAAFATGLCGDRIPACAGMTYRAAYASTPSFTVSAMSV